ncbi:thiamine phosphate synthase [soil metagenome]
MSAGKQSLLPTRRPLICLITKGASCGIEGTLEAIRAAIGHSVPLIQIREKQLPTRELYKLTSAAVKAAENTNTMILVNERFDIAIDAGADGVHLPSYAFTADDVRRVAGPKFIIGVSCHSADDVRVAKDIGADYVTLGPVFASPGKGTPIGIEAFASALRDVAPFPVIALGGIDASNYRTVIDTGAAGFAAIRYLNDIPALRKLMETL